MRGADDEADESLQIILDELRIDNDELALSPSPEGHQRREDDEEAEETNGGQDEESAAAPSALAPDFQLPSTPTGNLQQKANTSDPDEDSLEARMSALKLPSVPSTRPQSKDSTAASRLGPSKKDHNVEEWCIICLNDATVRCIGCDGDLYCARCWREGHQGEGAGYEERRHRWAKYDMKNS